ncbi:NHL DOMAIN PROTEIN [Salix koriyanagi]|uniref:NHL DOMAIN PROTEIN n=1 Tax=Salix koriyanagi TaxID=2511006 RepID=A0A9Q0ZTY1_9ROSI|nr:NHL DOMAIN PROTEIN [Salix koriyanagi]
MAHGILATDPIPFGEATCMDQQAAISVDVGGHDGGGYNRGGSCYCCVVEREVWDAVFRWRLTWERRFADGEAELTLVATAVTWKQAATVGEDQVSQPEVSSVLINRRPNLHPSAQLTKSFAISLMSSSTKILALFFILGPILSSAITPHVIHFRSPGLYPESLTYDHSAQHFIVGSLDQRTVNSVSDAGVIETIISDPSLPPNASFLGLAVDKLNNRLFAVIHSFDSLHPFNGLASYDLRSRQRLFLSSLPSSPSEEDGRSPIANDVALDFKGNAYVTNSAGNFIWKTNTGKLFKVDADDGTARNVLLNEDLLEGDGIAIRGDGVVLVVSNKKLWFLKSDDSWGEGVVYDKIDLDGERYPTSVVVGREGRAYVLYGCLMEGLSGKGGRELFDVEEVRSEKESEDEKIWMYVLIGLGLTIFLIWRFQMKQLIRNMDKKVN